MGFDFNKDEVKKKSLSALSLIDQRRPDVYPGIHPIAERDIITCVRYINNNIVGTGVAQALTPLSYAHRCSFYDHGARIMSKSANIQHRLWSTSMPISAFINAKTGLGTPSFSPKPLQIWKQRNLSAAKSILFNTRTCQAVTSTLVCTTTARKTFPSLGPRSTTAYFSQQIWRRAMHASSRKREKPGARRNKSSTSISQNGRPIQDKPVANKSEPPSVDPISPSNRYLHLPHMPKMPHRPSKEELLAAATGFWSRLKVRFKWFSIRSSRPWNIDDWSAFVSWFVLGNIVWIFVGTTTFFSLVIISINTVVAQGMTWTLNIGSRLTIF